MVNGQTPYLDSKITYIFIRTRSAPEAGGHPLTHLLPELLGLRDRRELLAVADRVALPVVPGGDSVRTFV